MLSSRTRRDELAGKLFRLCAMGACVLALIIAFVLMVRSGAVVSAVSLRELVLGDVWRPSAVRFGFRPFILGTMAVTLCSTVIAAPLSLLAAVYMAEYSSLTLRRVIEPIVDLMAGVPSVVYGMWGVLVIVPGVAWLARLMGTSSSGYSLLAASLVLAVMIVPYILQLCSELFRLVPRGMVEASMSLGATKWQTVRLVIIRKAMPGIVAAIVLALCRAMGETMAVLMVAGNVPKVPRGLFDPVYPLPALIANSYGEVMSVPLYESALMLGALMLFVIVLVFTIGSRWVLSRFVRSMG